MQVEILTAIDARGKTKSKPGLLWPVACNQRLNDGGFNKRYSQFQFFCRAWHMSGIDVDSLFSFYGLQKLRYVPLLLPEPSESDYFFRADNLI